jgi:ATP-dependent DNA helicase RecQ
MIRAMMADDELRDERRDELLGALHGLTGRVDAEFRDGQREAIELLVGERARVLVVQRTGWGKSAVYFISTHLLRERGAGPTLLISPLLALMRNQITAAERLGLRCMTVNSSANTTIDELSVALEADTVDLLLISPERLANPEFAAKVMPLVGRRPGLIVIDEVHCISDWGHDFRPDYRRIGRLIERLNAANVPVLGCTATANDRVVADVSAQLGDHLTVLRGPLRRDGLALSTIRLDRQAERLAWLDRELGRVGAQDEGSGIIYTLTVRDADNVAAWLNSRGHHVLAYHSVLDEADKLEAEQRLLGNEVDALVATVALGMGYDKPDLAFVFHFQSPGSPVGYYQQVGRAGRALDTSRAVLLRGNEDEQIQNYFIEQAFADEPMVRDVIAAFDGSDVPLSLTKVQVALNIKMGALEKVVKQLDADGALRRVGGQTYERTLLAWEYPSARIDEVTMARRLEQQSMVDYVTTTDCRMLFLARLLDDEAIDRCRICDNCVGEAASAALPAESAAELPVELIAAAEAFLRQRPLQIAPRKQRFDDTTGKRTTIPPDEQLEPGRALAIWGDAGWGRLVRDAKEPGGSFDDQLVDAVAEMLRAWAPDPAPEWVAVVPSLRHPELMASLAERVAARLGLPFHPVIAKVHDRPPQASQQNSYFQQRNVAGAFAVVGDVPAGPVFLLDDAFDSGWTLTEVGRLLRRHGAGFVYPATLASSAGRQ